MPLPSFHPTHPRQSELDVLWGGWVRQFEVDLSKRELRLRVEVISESESTEYALRFVQVSNLRLDRSVEDWEATELTSVEVSARRDGIDVTLDLWSTTVLEVVCQDFVVEVSR